MEEFGIATLCLGSCRDIMAQVHSPRSVFLDYPLGRQCGPPHNADLQRKILRDSLTVLTSATGPGTVVDLAYEWSEPFTWETHCRDIEAMLREENASNRVWLPKA